MSDQIVVVQVPHEQLEALKAELRQQAPNVLIGTKDLGDGTVSLAVTLFSEDPEVLERVMATLQGDAATFQNVPAAGASLSDLVARAKAAQTEQP